MQPANIIDDDDDIPMSFEGYSEYLKYKLCTIAAVGGTVGLSSGHYVGNLAAYRGYTYAFKGTMFGCAFFSTAYLLNNVRKKDDYINYGIAGGVNSAWMVARLYGPKRGAFAGLAGLVGGAIYKIGGTALYDHARESWVEYRRYVLETSIIRQVQPRKPSQFPPRDGTPEKYLQHRN